MLGRVGITLGGRLADSFHQLLGLFLHEPAVRAKWPSTARSSGPFQHSRPGCLLKASTVWMSRSRAAWSPSRSSRLAAQRNPSVQPVGLQPVESGLVGIRTDQVEAALGHLLEHGVFVGPFVQTDHQTWLAVDQQETVPVKLHLVRRRSTIAQDGRDDQHVTCSHHLLHHSTFCRGITSLILRGPERFDATPPWRPLWDRKGDLWTFAPYPLRLRARRIPVRAGTTWQIDGQKKAQREGLTPFPFLKKHRPEPIPQAGNKVFSERGLTKSTFQINRST